MIGETCAEPMIIAELAEISFMSEPELRKCFQQRYGMTIYQRVLECRTGKAWELLANGDDQVKEIANLVGHSNISRFSEAFQKKFGRTPNMYVKSFKH